MNRSTYAVGAVVAVLVAAVGLGLYFNQPSGVAVQPSQLPTASPTPTATPTASPAPSAALFPHPGEGDLQPGRYTAQLPVGDSAAVTFTVPDGWTAYADPPGVLRGLLPTGDPGTGGPGGIALQFRDVTTLKGDPCHWSGHADDISVGPTVGDLVEALRKQTAYEASEPVNVMVGGYAGQRVDIVSPTKPFNADDDAPACDEGRWRFWDGEIYAQGPANRWQTNILDVDGTRLVIVSQDFPGTSASDRAELDAIVDSMVIDPGTGAPSPAASSAPQPTPTPDPELVRAAAALQYQADGVANLQAFRALYENNRQNPEQYTAGLWGRYLAALNQLQVPADTAADLRDLIRKVTRVQAAERESATANGDAWWRARRHIRDRTTRMVDAANRVRADLGLAGVSNTGLGDQGPSYP